MGLQSHPPQALNNQKLNLPNIFIGSKNNLVNYMDPNLQRKPLSARNSMEHLDFANKFKLIENEEEHEEKMQRKLSVDEIEYNP